MKTIFLQMPCDGMSLERGIWSVEYTNQTAAGEEQQLVTSHTKRGRGRVEKKSHISHAMALPPLYQADPKHDTNTTRRT